MLNKVQLIGRLGAEPEVRHLENGAAVARLRLATSEYYNDKDGQRQEITEWHSIVAWRALADIAEKYMHKGDLIYVEGSLSTRSWQAENGETKYSTEIKAQSIRMLGGKKEGGTPSNRPPMPDEKDAPPPPGGGKIDRAESPMPDGGDDLPF